MTKLPPMPEIPEDQKTPLVVFLLSVIHAQSEMLKFQSEQIQGLREEVARLKGQKPKPNIKPSGMQDALASKLKDKKDPEGKRPGSDKRSKLSTLVIHETKVIRCAEVPFGSEFKGYKNYTVQGIVLEPYNIVYRMERWQMLDGKYIEATLPKDVKSHFDVTLVSFILYQYHQCHVTQPLLLEQLHEYGIDISAGQLDVILTQDKGIFHTEKDLILPTALEVSSYVQVDDTGARHEGNNGFCTHIGNAFFAWFESSASKSRINFLELLKSGNRQYVLNEDGFLYMAKHRLPKMMLAQLKSGQKTFESKSNFEDYLKSSRILDARAVRIATEGALIGSLYAFGLNRSLVILSDDAGQFNILLHALCWIHAERLIHKLVGFHEAQRAALKAIRSQIWEYYFDLKSYVEAPTKKVKISLLERFDVIFKTTTCFASLNVALKRLYKNKAELLLVLDRSDVPLHNNASETDIREYVKRRKVSGGTRSELGRQSRDTFTSLKKTCRKLGVSFWSYLKDRISGSNLIPNLSELIRLKAAHGA